MLKARLSHRLKIFCVGGQSHKGKTQFWGAALCFQIYWWCFSDIFGFVLQVVILISMVRVMYDFLKWNEKLLKWLVIFKLIKDYELKSNYEQLTKTFWFPIFKSLLCWVFWIYTYHLYAILYIHNLSTRIVYIDYNWYKQQPSSVLKHKFRTAVYCNCGSKSPDFANFHQLVFFRYI